MKRVYQSPYFLYGSLFILAVLTALSLQGCQSNPVKAAETLDQKAFALYGSFVIFEEQAAALAVQASTPQSVKTAMAKADATAKPIMDNLLQAVRVYESVQAQLAAGTTTAERVAIATADLRLWVNEATPVVTDLITAVKGAKK